MASCRCLVRYRKARPCELRGGASERTASWDNDHDLLKEMAMRGSNGACAINYTPTVIIRQWTNGIVHYRDGKANADGMDGVWIGASRTIRRKRMRIMFLALVEIAWRRGEIFSIVIWYNILHCTPCPAMPYHFDFPNIHQNSDQDLL